MEFDWYIYLFRPSLLWISADVWVSIVNVHNSFKDVSAQVLFAFSPASLHQITHFMPIVAKWKYAKHLGTAKINRGFVALYMFPSHPHQSPTSKSNKASKHKEEISRGYFQLLPSCICFTPNPQVAFAYLQGHGSHPGNLVSHLSDCSTGNCLQKSVCAPYMALFQIHCKQLACHLLWHLCHLT